jgi:hypothetical protein
VRTADVVHQDIDLGTRRLDELIGTVRRREVHPDHVNGPGTGELCQLGRRRSGTGHHVGTLVDEGAYDGESDAAACAGDDSDLTGEGKVHVETVMVVAAPAPVTTLPSPRARHWFSFCAGPSLSTQPMCDAR